MHAETGTPMDEMAKELKRKAFRADKLLPGVSISAVERSGSHPHAPGRPKGLLCTTAVLLGHPTPAFQGPWGKAGESGWHTGPLCMA